ncbi:MAG TPA: hypothetical protein VIO16_06850 [Dehalococcoidia bacterium]
MSAWLIGLVTFIYLWVTVNEYLAGNTPMAIVYFGYSIANVGLIILAIKGS